MWLWLRTNVDPVTSLAAIVGVAVSIIGFGATIYQLSSTATALRATNTYQIQKDGRELDDVLQKDAAYLAVKQNKATPEQQVAAEYSVWKSLNFYLSVFRQVDAGGVSSEFSDSLAKDFCDFVKVPAVDNAWKDMMKNNNIGEPHKVMREKWCEK